MVIILKTFEEITEDESICGYCYKTDYGKYKSVHTPNGYYMCEGAWCKDAYKSYLEESNATEKMVRYQNSIKLINKEEYLNE